MYEKIGDCGKNTNYKSLQEWRKKQGLTQRELSEITGIPISTIQKIEIGDRDISRLGAKILLLLSRALGVSMEQLITNEE